MGARRLFIINGMLIAFEERVVEQDLTLLYRMRVPGIRFNSDFPLQHNSHHFSRVRWHAILTDAAHRMLFSPSDTKDCTSPRTPVRAYNRAVVCPINIRKGLVLCEVLSTLEYEVQRAWIGCERICHVLPDRNTILARCEADVESQNNQ